MICQECNTRMKPLFTGFFCPNDCDRPQPKRGAINAWEAILPKIAPGHRDFISNRAERYRGGLWYMWIDMYDDCHCFQSMKTSDQRDASLVITIDSSGRPAVTKSRQGYLSISDIPDYDGDDD